MKRKLIVFLTSLFFLFTACTVQTDSPVSVSAPVVLARASIPVSYTHLDVYKRQVDASCGKCTPCRVGTKRMYEILDKITRGKATMEDLDKLEELCYHVKSNSLCGLGQTAPNPILSTLRNFRDEYVARIVDKKCPAGVCKDLLTYQILSLIHI